MTLAIAERVAKNRPAEHKTPTRTEKDSDVDGDPADPGLGEDRQVDADVVAAVGEGDGGDPERLRAILLLPGLLLAAVALPVVLPRLPGGPEAQGQRQQPKVGDGGLGQEGGTVGGGHSDGQDRGEAEVLSSHDPPGRALLPGAAAEEQRQQHDVVHVGNGEQPGRLRHDASVHIRHLHRGCARGPGEVARFRELAGNLICDQAAERVGVTGTQVWVNQAFDFDAQRPARPASAGMRVDNSGDRPRGSHCRTDHVRVYAVCEAAHDVGGDLVADVTDEGGYGKPGHRVTPRLTKGHRDQAGQCPGR